MGRENDLAGSPTAGENPSTQAKLGRKKILRSCFYDLMILSNLTIVQTNRSFLLAQVYYFNRIASNRLATGKLMDLLNPYLELYNGNAAHMMAYLNMNTEGDNKVVTAYHECIELQQQLHTCTNIVKKLQNSSNTDEGRKVAEMIEKGLVTANSLLHQASTDKLRVITENVVDMLLFFYFQMNDVVSDNYIKKTDKSERDSCPENSDPYIVSKLSRVRFEF